MKRFLKIAVLLAACGLFLFLLFAYGNNRPRRRTIGRIYEYTIPDGELTDELRELYRKSPSSLMRPVYSRSGDLYCYGAGVRLIDWDQKQPIEYQIFPHGYNGDYADVVFYLSNRKADYPTLAELVALPQQTTDEKALRMKQGAERAQGLEYLASSNGFDYYLYLYDAAYHGLEDEAVIRQFEDTCDYLRKIKDHLLFIDIVDYVYPVTP